MNELLDGGNSEMVKQQVEDELHEIYKKQVEAREQAEKE